jgi:hypothetical protein
MCITSRLLYPLCLNVLFRWLISMSRLSPLHKVLALWICVQYDIFLWRMVLRPRMNVEVTMCGFPIYSMSQQAVWSSAHQNIKERQYLILFHFHNGIYVGMNTVEMLEETLKLLILSISLNIKRFLSSWQGW